LRGPVGTDVVLTIRQAESAEVRSVRITREMILIQSVKFQRVGDSHGYIRIAQLDEKSGADVGRALASLQSDGAIKGLVLDLRNSPGGLLLQATKVADVFVDDGVIVRTKGRTDGDDEVFHAHRDGDFDQVPVVVLVNRGTAAGSEIVAAALRDNRRSLLVGTPTSGTGTIRTILPLGNRAALSFTTSRAYSPTGSSLDLGLQPDETIESAFGKGFPSAEDAEVAAALRLLAGRPAGADAGGEVPRSQ
jgi:carboxyl-terminal processing protease